MEPRTYRLGAGTSLFLGGLARIDLVTLPQETIYLTVWASDMLPLHAGKTESADALYAAHLHKKLFPPSSAATTMPLEPLKVRCTPDVMATSRYALLVT